MADTTQAGSDPINLKTGKGGAAGSTTATKKDEKKFNIPQTAQDKYPDLIELIINTESMNDEERDYWFQILPIMTDEQITKFRGILVNEKEQLAKLDQEYEEEIERLNEKHLIEWQEFETKQKREKIKKAETTHEEAESEEEERILDELEKL